VVKAAAQALREEACSWLPTPKMLKAVPADTLESLIGQTVVRVWVSDDDCTLLCASGLTARMAADGKKPRYYLAGARLVTEGTDAG
jgi:hypothetical protein